MESAIKINSLLKTYGKGEPVLNRLDLELPSGIIFGLIGPNGAGKSTLIGILTGLLDYNDGSVRINGLLLNSKNELEIKRQMASVLQPPLLFENFTSYEFLTYVCDMYGISGQGLNDRINSLLTYFEIKEYTYAAINQLSSGSRKKLAFCAGILTEPAILFLDEPFESVDVISIGRMKSLLRKLKGRGCTVFITSHILEVVENLCDDIAILHEGKILAYLDAGMRSEIQKDSSLSEIFEQYINVKNKQDDLPGWL
ncbi:MAG: ABC transporter ATP-binding protein [Balneolaceae bacterium]